MNKYYKDRSYGATEKNGIIRYENKYGVVELSPLEYKPINAISHNDVPDDMKFNMDTAEKIVLITENRRVQISFDYPGLTKALILHHLGPSICAVCRVFSLVFKSDVNPQEELDRLHQRSYCMI